MHRFAMAAGLLFSFSVFAAGVTVGCPGGTPGTYPSINAALAVLDAQGPNTITVSGTCTENIVLNQRERLTIQGAPDGGTIVSAATFVPTLEARNCPGLVLRNLTVRGINRPAVSLFTGTTPMITGALIETTGGGLALDLVGIADSTIGGFNATDAVTVRGGARCTACSAFFAGWVIIESSTLAGLVVDAGRVSFFGQRPTTPPAGGPNVVRNNFNGIQMVNGGAVVMDAINRVENNSGSGAILLGGHLTVNGGSLPDGTLFGTIFQNNQRNGVSVLENSQFRSNGANRVVGNGATGTQFSAGISSNHSSVVALTGGEISGSIGPGILADSTATIRLAGTTISGNSEEGVRVLHGAVLESFAGTTVPANGSGSVTCDATAIVFGDFTGFAPFECAKKDK